jgi:hypothetical protein
MEPRPTMARFYFHVRDGETFTKDDEGVDLPDLEAVRWEAEQGARGFKKLFESRGALDHQCFEVTDEAGVVVLIYPFHQA